MANLLKFFKNFKDKKVLDLKNPMVKAMLSEPVRKRLIANSKTSKISFGQFEALLVVSRDSTPKHKKKIRYKIRDKVVIKKDRDNYVTATIIDKELFKDVFWVRQHNYRDYKAEFSDLLEVRVYISEIVGKAKDTRTKSFKKQQLYKYIEGYTKKDWINKIQLEKDKPTVLQKQVSAFDDKMVKIGRAHV